MHFEKSGHGKMYMQYGGWTTTIFFPTAKYNLRECEKYQGRTDRD